MRVSVLVLCGVLCACTPAAQRRPDRSKSAEAKYKAAVERGEVKIGMTEAEVTKGYGKPKKKVKSTRDHRPVVRWLYMYSEVIFDADGFVIFLSGY